MPDEEIWFEGDEVDSLCALTRSTRVMEGRWKGVVPEGEAEAEGAVERVRRDVPRRSEADGDVARPGRDTRKAAVRGSCEVVVAALLIF